MSARASAQMGGGEGLEQRDNLKEKVRAAPLDGNKLVCPLRCQASYSLAKSMLCCTAKPLKDGESKLVCKHNSTPPIFQRLKLHEIIGQIKPLVKATR